MSRSATSGLLLMRLTLQNYWPAILLLIVPYLWWMGRYTAVDLSPKHLRLSTLIRSAIVCLIVLALMQPVLYRSSDYVSVIYLLDISQSVAPDAIRKAMDWIQQTNASAKPDHTGFVAFASNSVGLATIDDLKKVQVSNWGRKGDLDQTATDISGALDHALRSFAPNHLKHIVLISDGNENSGELSAILPKLNRENVRVFTAPLEPRLERDVWIESMLAPAAVTADEQFPVEVHVYSQFETSSTVEV